MLFIEDDDPDRGDRGEHGRARADDHARLTRAHARPLLPPLARRQPAVPECYGRSKALPKPVDRLRGQGDLRHQADRPASLRQAPRDGPQVELRLPRAGDAVQQQRLGARDVERLEDGLQRTLLVGREHDGFGVRGSGFWASPLNPEP